MNLSHTEMMGQNSTETSTAVSSTRLVFYCPSEPEFTWNLHDTTFSWILAAIILTASPITVLLNALVIIAVKQRKELQKRSNIVLSSMAIADLLVGAVSMPISATVDLLIIHQVYLERVCALNTGNIALMECFLFSSLFHLIVIAWERNIAVTKWIDYMVIVTNSRLKKLAIIAWLAAIFISLPLAVMFGIGAPFEVQKIWYMMASLCIALSVIAIVCLYVMVYIGVRKRRTKEIAQVTALVQAKLETKVAKTTGLLTAAVIFTLILGGVLTVLGDIFPVFRKNSTFRIAETLLQLNSLMNPVIYCYRDRRFRKAILELLRIKKPQATQPTRARDDAARLRKRKDKFGSVEDVQSNINSQNVGKQTRLTRSTSCDLGVALSAGDDSQNRFREMMLTRYASNPCLFKNSSLVDSLHLGPTSSVVLTSVTVHTERNTRDKARKTTTESSSGNFDVHNAQVNVNKTLKLECLEADVSGKVGNCSQNVENTEAAARPISA